MCCCFSLPMRRNSVTGRWKWWECFWTDILLVLGGSSQDGRKRLTMVSFRPLRIGLWDPFQIPFSWLINGGDPNHLLSGVILQVGSGHDYFLTPKRPILFQIDEHGAKKIGQRALLRGLGWIFSDCGFFSGLFPFRKLGYRWDLMYKVSIESFWCKCQNVSMKSSKICGHVG